MTAGHASTRSAPRIMCLPRRDRGHMEFDSVRFYNALVHSMSDAVIYADAQGRIQFWNSGAVRIFGFSEPEAIGRSLDIIIPENLRERHWAGFNETMRTAKSHYQAGVLLAVPAFRKDGSRISVEFTVVPFRHQAGGMLGIAAVMRVTGERVVSVLTRREQWKTTRLSPRYSLWRSARPSHAQLHTGWLRISGEMYGATTTSF
jgi:PAS domain S-box-containing protein